MSLTARAATYQSQCDRCGYSGTSVVTVKSSITMLLVCCTDTQWGEPGVSANQDATWASLPTLCPTFPGIRHARRDNPSSIWVSDADLVIMVHKFPVLPPSTFRDHTFNDRTHQHIPWSHAERDFSQAWSMTWLSEMLKDAFPSSQRAQKSPMASRP